VSAAAGFDQFGCALLPNTKDQVFYEIFCIHY
jgi:hypothetical protein